MNFSFADFNQKDLRRLAKTLRDLTTLREGDRPHRGIFNHGICFAVSETWRRKAHSGPGSDIVGLAYNLVGGTLEVIQGDLFVGYLNLPKKCPLGGRWTHEDAFWDNARLHMCLLLAHAIEDYLEDSQK